ncbi:MAG: PilC/PilY family type IV pilus protein [Polyangiaceae bacterium]
MTSHLSEQLIIKGAPRRGAQRSRARLATGIAAAIALAFGVMPNVASAQQIDVSPPLPNVMLLLDTSGSMEKNIDGTTAKCQALGTPSDPNRWGQAVQSLTGGIAPYFSCVSMSRATGTQFEEEYTINGKAPYDINYYLPFSRPAALTAANEACVVSPIALPGATAPDGVGKTTPKALGGAATDFDGAIDSRVLGTANSCQFTQLSNGALDGARDLIRFGLMTFDSDVLPGVGITPGATITVGPSPFAGLWSYFPDWNKVGGASSAFGRPYNCLSDQLFEVGARNPAAPPWEGRLIGVPGNSNATIDDIRQQNDRIQVAINAMRPYGATPIAGMMDDVKYYYWGDPTGPEKTDVYVQGGCRDEYIILITDGAPNLDARPQCSPEGPTPPNGKCPFRLPEEIAGQLAAGNDGSLSGKKVQTYVIGFAVSKIEDDTPIECETLAANKAQFDSVCADPTKQALYGACCTLEKIAVAGGTEKAYFVKTQQDLSSALADIISRIGRKITTRTVPAYSPQIADVTNDPTKPITNAALFLSAFTPSPGEAWRGTVQRTRYVCNSSFQLDAPKYDPAAGDDFAQNLNNGSGGKLSERRFAVIEPKALPSGQTNPTGTIRPFVASSGDGVPVYSADSYAPLAAADAIPKLTSTSLKIQAHDCPNQLNNAWLTADACKQVALDFAFGSATSVSMPAGFAPFVSRAKNAFGDIFHATPTVVGPPNALIRDDTYQKFASLHKDRPTVLYAATNDGLLHAFDTGVAALERNELWSMVLPAVLPKLIGVYPAGHTLMLDGAPVVKDAVWDRKSSELTDETKWHTTLVAGFGQAGRGYYGVDVTDPRRPDGEPPGAGPPFRGQRTDLPPEPIGGAPTPLFGARSATPAITTVFADLGGSGGAREIGVAILPGGIENGPYGSTACDRANTDRSKDAGPTTDVGYAPRAKVRCWAAPGANVPGRSVSIVRLDTGEILRTFIRADDAPKALVDASRVTDTPLDSPMTGVPVVYPPQVGAVAQKVFIGDADGTLWRFDLTSKDPSQWKGELFFDTVNQTVDTSGTAWANGQPIVVPPVVALDRNGNLVVEVATGDQDVFTATGKNYLFSLSERLSSETVPKLRSVPNWYLGFSNGERVSGPMAVFDGILYFSTFAAAEATAICSGGLPKVWGRDFMTPDDPSILSKGGVRRLNPASASPVPDYIDPGFTGKIIPGVSINVTPTCANTSISSLDPYVPGSTHYSVSNVNSGSPSLLAQVGGQDAQGRPLKLEVALPKPRTPTSVDAWAAVVE